jgi:uncharacterized protein (TIGR02246 family)
MTNSPISDEQHEVWQVVQAINAGWVEGHPEALSHFFHPDMVIVTADLQMRAEGQEACVASYRNFCDQAKIKDYQELNPNVDVFGDHAVVIYRFDITYEMGGESYHDVGADLFVLGREGGQWQARWRTLFPYDASD